ncbi:MAG: ABC transporter substrate-binding protein [Bacillota bacterium]|nr:ABC transporter substrate-binding protein [Bacillota bacterium]
MLRRLGRVGLVTVAVAALLLAGCGGGGSSQNTAGKEKGTGTGASSSQGGGTITIGINADPPNLDPSGSTALVDRYVQNSIFDKLYDMDASLQVVPVLAASLPEVSADGKVYTIHLRQGIQFSDGTPFNADAVVFNLKRYMSPESARHSELSFVQDVQKVDEQTVRIILTKPFSPLLYTLTDRAGMMGSPAAIQKEGANFGQHPVGTGPFMFESRTKGDQIVLVRNPHYWQKGKPKADRLVWKVVTDDNVKVVNLKAGQLDIIDTVPAQSVGDLQSNSAFRVDIGPGLGFQGLYLNVNEPPFNNVYLRRAVDLAIDRAALVKVVFGQTADPGYGPFPAGTPAAAASGAVPSVDLAKVKQLLAQGGHPDGFSFTLKIAASPVNQQVAQVLKNMLAQAGITMNIQQEEFGTLLDDSTKHNFQASALGWSGRPDPDGNIYAWLYTGGSLNDSAYSNPQVDQLLDQARATNEMAQRVDIYRRVMEIVHQDVPYVYLYFPKNVKAYSSQLKGFVNVPDGIIRTADLSK